MGQCATTSVGLFDDDAAVSSLVLKDGRTLLFARNADDLLVFRVAAPITTGHAFGPWLEVNGFPRFLFLDRLQPQRIATESLMPQFCWTGNPVGEFGRGCRFDSVRSEGHPDVRS